MYMYVIVALHGCETRSVMLRHNTNWMCLETEDTT